MRALLFPALLLGCATTASGDTKRQPDEGPVVIELFTSQGCSSCPPAEVLLNKLARDGKLGDRAVAPLTFHVDYWDDLGWPDPYASAAWTERQREYAEALGDRRVYTPELVVAGGAGMVGSQATSVARANAAAPKRARPPASATRAPRRHRRTARRPREPSRFVPPHRAAARGAAPGEGGGLGGVSGEGRRPAVPRGGNAGGTLPSDRVVRRLELVAAPGKTASRRVALPATWKHVGALAFAQRTDRAIVGAATLPRL